MFVRMIAAAVMIAAASPSAWAVSPAAEEAAKTLSEIETDKSKLDPYCAMIGEFVAAGDDQAKIDALAEKFDELIRSFGPKFAAALDLHTELDDESEDGKAMIAAFEKVDSACPAAR